MQVPYYIPLLDYLRFAPAWVRDAIGVHPRTWRRWLDGTRQAPQSALVLAALLTRGHLVHPDWRGWSVTKDGLQDPDGELHTLEQIRAWRLLAGELLDMRRAEQARAALTGENPHAAPGHVLSARFSALAAPCRPCGTGSAPTALQSRRGGKNHK